MNGRSRGLVALAVEAWLIARVVAWDRKADREAQEYRDLAFDIARRSFTNVRQDGPFEYYESMEKFVESGVYDLDAGPGFAPETDTTTFNGSLWLLARRTFFANPDSAPPPDSPAFIGALAFYRTRAVADDFRWSWRNAQLEQDAFRGTIRASDEAYRQRTNFMGALILNHLASAVDAFLSARGRRPAAMPRMDFRSDPEEVTLSWRFGF